MVMKQKEWERCLEAVRKISKSGEPITSAALLEIMRYQETDKSDPMDIAAGWICNLRRWGYLKIVRGEKVPGPSRQLQVYKLTSWGEQFHKKGAARQSLKVAANPEKNED
jgi:hypothetical protein